MKRFRNTLFVSEGAPGETGIFSTRSPTRSGDMAGIQVARDPDQPGAPVLRAHRRRVLVNNERLDRGEPEKMVVPTQ